MVYFYLAVRNARNILHRSNTYDFAITLPCTDAMYIYMGLLIHKSHALDIQVYGHQCNIHVAVCSKTQLHLALVVGPAWK